MTTTKPATGGKKAKKENPIAGPVRVFAETSAPALTPSIAPPGSNASPKSGPVAVVQAPSAASSFEPPAVRAPESDSKSAAPVKAPEKVEKPAKQGKPVTELAVLLPGYQSKDGAQSELKALQLLGFRVKDATIVSNDNGSYSIRLAQMKSKASADEMASSLARMSFRAVVQTVQR